MGRGLFQRRPIKCLEKKTNFLFILLSPGTTSVVVCIETYAYLGYDKEVVGVYVGGPKCAHVNNAWRMSFIYHSMINLGFSTEMRVSPSRLVDIKMLESGARDNHVLFVIKIGRYPRHIFCFHWNVGFRGSSQS